MKPNRLREITRLCVYCGSSAGRLPEYAETARTMARAFIERDIGLVYGGASVGIMGVIADEMLARGGQVFGVIPQDLVDREVAHDGLTELYIVSSMHERKAVMAELSDGFIALPGGIGTIEELFEILTWAMLGIHDKPCGLLNAEGYYDKLAAFLDHAVAEWFVRPKYRSMLIVADDPVELLDRFERYEPPEVPQRIRKDRS